jgi:TPP-dependent pyruvate/acetoin dehydrogenase alpha subunit
MDILKVYDVTLAAVERARRGEGPTLIEAKTYRFKGHSRGDPGKYRSSDELCGWQARDPVPRFRQYILDEGIANATLTKIEDRVDKAIREAVEFAIAAADPESSDTYTHVYADNRE